MSSPFEVITIPDTTTYWFIRTDTGTLTEKFLEEGFIAIGYNGITVDNLANMSDSELKEKIKRLYEHEFIDLPDKSVKGRVTGILNRIKCFHSIKENDIVIIPSEHSDQLSFGIVTSSFTEEAYTETSEEYSKRKSVDWILPNQPIRLLSPKFYQVKRYRRSIYDVTEWAGDVTDSMLYDVYRKGENSYYSIKINTDDPINWVTLKDYLSDLHTLLTAINEEFNLGEDVDASEIKVNLQSRGILNLIQPKGRSLIYLALALGAISCTDKNELPTDDEQAKIEKVIETRSVVFGRAKKTNDELEVPKNTQRR